MLCSTRRTPDCRPSRGTISRQSSTSPTPPSAGSARSCPDWSRRSTLAIDARKNLDPLTTLIDKVAAGAGFADRHLRRDPGVGRTLATITAELQTNDNAVAGVIVKGGPAAAEVRQLFERLQPTLPILLANLVSVGRSRSPTSPTSNSCSCCSPRPSRRTRPASLPIQHQTGLQRPIPELQPEPQPAAALHHRIPAGPAAARRRARGLPGSAGG